MGELIQEASQQTALLVRQELALAQLEMKEKGKRAGMGAGLFGGAGAVAFYGGGVLIAAIVLVLATALEPWIAALIVAVVAVRGRRSARADREEAGRSGHPRGARAGDREHQERRRRGQEKGRQLMSAQDKEPDVPGASPTRPRL